MKERSWIVRFCGGLIDGKWKIFLHIFCSPHAMRWKKGHRGSWICSSCVIHFHLPSISMSLKTNQGSSSDLLFLAMPNNTKRLTPSPTIQKTTTKATLTVCTLEGSLLFEDNACQRPNDRATNENKRLRRMQAIRTNVCKAQQHWRTRKSIIFVFDYSCVQFPKKSLFLSVEHLWANDGWIFNLGICFFIPMTAHSGFMATVGRIFLCLHQWMVIPYLARLFHRKKNTHFDGWMLNVLFGRWFFRLFCAVFLPLIFFKTAHDKL